MKKIIFPCLEIVVPDSSATPVQSINLYKEKHMCLAQLILPAGTKPAWHLPIDHQLQQHFTTWSYTQCQLRRETGKKQK